MSQCLGGEVRNYKYGSKNARFVRIDNAELFFLFQSIRENHNLMREIVEEIDPVRGWMHFVEGIIDAEGCFKIIRGRERRTPKACLDTCNTDLSLLNLVREALKEHMGIDSGMSTQKEIPPRKTFYHLRIYSKEGVARFLSVTEATKLTNEKKPMVDAWLRKKR